MKQHGRDVKQGSIEIHPRVLKFSILRWCVAVLVVSLFCAQGFAQEAKDVGVTCRASMVYVAKQANTTWTPYRAPMLNLLGMIIRQVQAAGKQFDNLPMIPISPSTSLSGPDAFMLASPRAAEAAFRTYTHELRPFGMPPLPTASEVAFPFH